MIESGRYRIELDKDWSLEDLYRFPRAYEQVYFFFASVNSQLDNVDSERVQRAYRNYPWQGGYSAVNFFDELKYAIPRQARPKIVAIQKMSPGFFDLGLWVMAATSVALIIRKVAGSIDVCNTTYGNIYKGMQERKLLKLQVAEAEIKFKKSELNFIIQSGEQMAHLLGHKDVAALNDLTGSPYLTLKVLLSVYRRIRTLAGYVNSGKANFTQGEVEIIAKRPKQKIMVRNKTPRTRKSRK